MYVRGDDEFSLEDCPNLECLLPVQNNQKEGSLDEDQPWFDKKNSSIEEDQPWYENLADYLD